MKQDYKDAYARIKNRKVGKDIREFSFSEKYIFGRFDSFCTRLRNLLSMFKKINLYTRLFQVGPLRIWLEIKQIWQTG